MGKPAAVLGSMHVCPKKRGNTPHVGGPVCSGEGTVTIGGLPAARVGDKLVCVGGGIDKISSGSASVTIGGKPAARLGDSTAHGGKIVAGVPNILIS